MNREFILTEDGSHTIFVPEMGEHFHSVHGALQESLHIFIKNGYKKILQTRLSILEVGFGTGLNAFLTLLETNQDGKSVYYESWEAFPLTISEYSQLNYPRLLNTGQDLFNLLHDSDWGIEVKATPLFTVKKIKDDIRNFTSDLTYDLVYFDAFGPDYQPELWETGVFRKLSACMKKDSILVTYSAKGQVRRNLREAGFHTTKAPGPPGKREITVAIKT